MKKQLLLFIMMLLPMVASADASGSCGNNVTYSFNEATHTLTISGTGAMKDYYNWNGNDYGQPWVSYKDMIFYVIIETGVTSIGADAFYKCSAIISVEIPNSVTTIGYGAFYGCSGLTSVTIPNSVTSIGDCAFGGCSGLTSVTIPNSVTSIGSNTFYGCSGLTSVTIPNSVTSIGAWAFDGCCGLTSVTIPNSVTTIGQEAFSGCSGLTSVTIPNSVTSIGNYAFSGCSGLTSVTIGNNVTTIGEGAFCDCSGLTSVTIGNSVTTIGYEAFEGCSGLTSVHITDLEPWCKIAFVYVEANPLFYAHHLFLNGVEVKDLVIPNSVTSIGNYAFSGCSGLTSVTIPNSVTSIGSYAFYECRGLTSVTIPNSVTTIGEGAFYNCRGLTSMTIPNSVTTIGYSTFGYCQGLTSVTIPNSVTSIGNGAFYWCSGLTSVTIPNSVTEIGEGAFYGCSSLATLTLPEDIKIIKKGTFQYCSIKSVVIPAKVEYIYADAFNCNGTEEVKVLATTPPWAHDNAFNNYNIPLYVPTESINSYQSTNPWSKFSSLKSITGDVVDNKCKPPTISYKNGKLSFSCETEGASFQYTITDTDIKSGSGNEVNLTVTYTVSVYAIKSGFQNSDVATGTLCWIEVDPKREGIDDGDTAGANAIPAQAVLIQSRNGMLTVEGAEDGTQVRVYGMNGVEVGSGISRNGLATVSTNLKPGSVAIIKIGNRSVKITQ